MIDPRILNTLKSRNQNPAYSILITGYETKDDCSQEKLIIHLHQINKSINEIENLNGINILEKDLIIQSDMDYDEVHKSFKNTLKGFSNYYGKLPKPNPNIVNYPSHHVEMIETELKSEVYIKFNHEYSSVPAVIPTIDVKYKSYYTSYDVDFVKNKLGKYIAVRILFKKLKRKNNYPLINITVIGDKID